MNATHASPPDDTRLHSHGDSHGHGSRSGYVTGFILSVVLTAVPFWLVMARPLESAAWTAIAIFACAVVQILVHVIYFLHLDTKSEGGWTLVSFMFTVVILGVVLLGSIWVMYHLNDNMMPPTMSAPPQ